MFCELRRWGKSKYSEQLAWAHLNSTAIFLQAALCPARLTYEVNCPPVLSDHLLSQVEEKPKAGEKWGFWGVGIYCLSSVTISGTVAASITEGHSCHHTAISLPPGPVTTPSSHIFSHWMRKYPTDTSYWYFSVPYAFPTLYLHL